MQKYIDENEKLEYLSFFAEKEALFQTLVSMGKIILHERHENSFYPKTAWVTFDKEGKFLNFYFDEIFWNELTVYERCFVIGHECLHVLLYHGIRLSQTEERKIGNIAADLIVNHLLVDSFGFSLAQLPIAKVLCWRDKIFSRGEFSFKLNKTLPNIKNCTYEIYYDFLVSQKEFANGALSGIQPIDDHGEGIPNMSEETGDSPAVSNSSNKSDEPKNNEKDVQDSKTESKHDDSQKESEGNNRNNKECSSDEMSERETEDLVEKVFGSTSDKFCKNFVEKVEKQLEDMNTYGANPYSSHMTDAKSWKAKKNITWKKIFAQIAKKALKENEKEQVQWVKKNKRNSLLPEDFYLPHTVDVDFFKKNKLKIQLYIDFSGSCRNLEKDFWLAYDSISKKDFEIELFTYSDYIVPVDQKIKILEGSYGNAPFQIIEDNVLKLMKNKKTSKYPNCVVVFTDGHAPGVKAQKPENWIWILPKNNSSKRFIPLESTLHYLEDICKNEP